MTRKDTLAAIKAIGSCTARFSEGEYRVSINPVEIKRLTGCTGAEAIARNESLASYCSDSADAIGTARALWQSFLIETGTANAAAAAPVTQVGVIDLRATWTGLLPCFLAILEDGTEEGRAMVRGELKRMAEAADKFNAGVA